MLSTKHSYQGRDEVELGLVQRALNQEADIEVSWWLSNLGWATEQVVLHVELKKGWSNLKPPPTHYSLTPYPNPH